MRVDIDPSSPRPPSEQIAERIRFAVSSGRLVAGDRIPSVRGLAASARINPNTVSRAYRVLEQEGTVVTRPGAGVYVASAARDRCAASRDRLLRDRFARLVEDALDAGLRPDQVLALALEVIDGPERVVA